MTAGFGESIRWDGVDLGSIVKAVSDSSTKSMYDVAATLDQAQEPLTAALAETRRALDLLVTGAVGDATDAQCRAIAAMLVWLAELVDGATQVSSATTTVAQGFDEVVRTIGNTSPGPPPIPFDHPDTQLSWLDQPPLEVYESSIRDATTDVRTAMANYQNRTNTALRVLPVFGPAPGSGDGPTGGSPAPLGPPPSGPPPSPTEDTMAEAATEPLRVRTQRPGPTPPLVGFVGFGPVGHDAEDAALADADTTPVVVEPDTTPIRPVRRFVAPTDPAETWTQSSAAESIFDVDVTTVRPVIGE